LTTHSIAALPYLRKGVFPSAASFGPGFFHSRISRGVAAARISPSAPRAAAVRLPIVHGSVATIARRGQRRRADAALDHDTPRLARQRMEQAPKRAVWKGGRSIASCKLKPRWIWCRKKVNRHWSRQSPLGVPKTMAGRPS
jgi:hypothetical protein